jgi:L-fucose mutarotase/ribose pyranase (RbsD/FucU family)
MSDVGAAVAGGWESRLRAIVPLFGHRNWIVVADAAYPAQSNAGIKTVATGGEQVDVLRKVIQLIGASKHIRAHIYLDAELPFVAEADAPGVDEYRAELKELLAGSELIHIRHEQTIAKLDQAALVFSILILKTTMTVPYTSVFFELDCGYWNDEAEQRLRKEIAMR